MLSLTIIVAVLSLASLSSAKACPKIVTQNPFDITKYVGFWYEIYRSDIIFEVGNRCVNATYTPNPDGSVGVWNQAVNFVGDYTSIRGSAKVKNASEPGAFVVTFSSPLEKGDYNVIASNYEDYSLVYACQNIPIIDRDIQFIWILARTKSLSQAVVDQLKKTLTDMGADVGALKKTEQNC